MRITFWRVNSVVLAGVLLATVACSKSPEFNTPVVNPPLTEVDFSSGSRIDARELTPVQVSNLALLGKVWGFAKYHHSGVVYSTRNWDYELFRIAPQVLAASDRASATQVMLTWLDGLGAIPDCRPCVTAPAGAPLPADNAWIDDAATLGTALSDRLKTMYRNRPPNQRYVSFVTGVGNPDFTSEARYPTLTSPDAGYRLLALFRFWNIIKYWFPYRDVMNEDWNAVLAEYIPVMMKPLSGDEYRLALIRLIGRIHDTHANLWSDLRVQPPVGTSQAPLLLRFVDNRLLVSGYTHATLGPATGLKVGVHRRRFRQQVGGFAAALLSGVQRADTVARHGQQPHAWRWPGDAGRCGRNGSILAGRIAAAARSARPFTRVRA